MGREVAALIVETMLRQGRELDDLLIRAQPAVDETEFRELKLAIGKVLGSMLLDVMNPIFEEHPDLRPAELA